MKKLLYSLTMVGAVCLGSGTAHAIGWPSGHQGVMLQGFYWDSQSVTSWTKLTAQAEELAPYFNLIWIPNGAKCASGGYSNGYDPVYWFSNYSSGYGNETQLRAMVDKFKELSTGIIGDVVINHRSGKSNWVDFPSETWNGKTYSIPTTGICSTDEVWNESAYSGMARGAADTGEDFSGARDLDHTNATVQENCKAYCNFLLQDMGYIGFRLDMVKGYAGYYTKMYNQACNVGYSVGEYWDGSYDAVAAWIEATGKTSAAFDFPCKYQMNDAFTSGDLTKLVWNANGVTPQPAGLIHYGYPQYSVTFIDNHDTGRDDWNKFNGNVLAAYAFLMGSPGTPCVFYPHWTQYKADLKKMIDCRNSMGITNTSTVKVLQSSGNCYMAEITGTKGKMAVKVGSAMVSPSGYTDSQLRCYGTDWAIWTSGPVTTACGAPLVGSSGGSSEAMTIYFDNSKAGWTTPYIHYWGATETAWPGVAMTKVSGNTWKYDLPAGTIGILFNAGDGDATKTEDFSPVANHIYDRNGDQGEYSGGSTGGGTGGGTEMSIYFDNTPSGWTTPYIHYWGSTESKWPGVAMTKVSGQIWRYTVPAGTTGVLFNAGDGDATKTQDFVAVANHVYTTSGDQGEYSGGGTGGGGSFTVFFDNFNAWSSSAPHIWAWNDEGNLVSEAWPGPAMTSAGGTLYKWSSEYTPTGIIITNDAGDKAGNDNISNPVNGATYYSDGTTTKPSTSTVTVAIAGAFNDWSGSANAVVASGGIATFVIDDYVPEKEEQGEGFKVIVTQGGISTWYGSSNSIGNEETITLEAGAEIPNILLRDWTPGSRVTFTFNVATLSLSAKWSLSTVCFATEDASAGQEQYFDLSGRRVSNPVRGVYIVRKGSKVSKKVVL